MLQKRGSSPARCVEGKGLDGGRRVGTTGAASRRCVLVRMGASVTSLQIATIFWSGTKAPRCRVLGEPPAGQRQDPHGALTLMAPTADSSTTHAPAERAPRLESCPRLSRNQGPPGERPGERPGDSGHPQTRAALPGGPRSFPGAPDRLLRHSHQRTENRRSASAPGDRRE